MRPQEPEILENYKGDSIVFVIAYAAIAFAVMVIVCIIAVIIKAIA